MVAVRIKRLADVDDSVFAQIYAIYAASIERAEQKPEWLLRANMQRPDYIILIAADTRVRGFAMCYAPPGENFWLLEYMAVTARVRSTGLGSRLFRAAVKHADRPYALAEVDALEPDAPGARTRARRLAFYARLGCRRLDDIDYVLPLPFPMLPMILLVHADPARKSVSTAQVEAWLQNIFAEVYNRKGRDPRIAAMLKGAGDRLRLAPIAPGG